MLKRLLLYAICLFAIAPFACTKSEDDLRPAQRATGGLMPDNDPKFEADYVADQSQVKLVAARTISYEPLDTFRGKAAAEPKEDASADEPAPARKTAGAAPRPRGTPSAAPSGGGGSFWSRVGMKALMGGGAAPPGPRPAAPGRPAPKGDAPAADDEAADDEGAAEEEEADADEEESAEEEEAESEEEEPAADEGAESDKEEPAEDEEAEPEEEKNEEEGSEEEPKKDAPDKEPKDTDSNRR